MKITIDGRQYDLNMSEALKIGVLRPESRTARFKDVKIGELFMYISPDDTVGEKCLAIKSSDGFATRIAGIGYLETEIGKTNRGCSFGYETMIYLYRNNGWVNTIEM